MTKKEVLYRELINLRNQLADAENQNDVEQLCRHRKYEGFKIVDLQNSIKYAKASLEEKIKKEQNLDFLKNTEEGKQFFDEQNKIREGLLAENTKAYEDFDTWLQKEIVSMINDNWTASGSMNRVEIGLKNIDPKRKFQFMFGHSFDIHYDDHTQKLSANYGSMGSFELLGEDTARVEYLTGMSKVLSSTEFLQKLIKMFNEFNTILKRNNTEIRIVEDRINNAYLIFKTA